MPAAPAAGTPERPRTRSGSDAPARASSDASSPRAGDIAPGEITVPRDRQPPQLFFAAPGWVCWRSASGSRPGRRTSRSVPLLRRDPRRRRAHRRPPAAAEAEAGRAAAAAQGDAPDPAGTFERPAKERKGSKEALVNQQRLRDPSRKDGEGEPGLLLEHADGGASRRRALSAPPRCHRCRWTRGSTASPSSAVTARSPARSRWAQATRRRRALRLQGPLAGPGDGTGAGASRRSTTTNSSPAVCVFWAAILSSSRPFE